MLHPTIRTSITNEEEELELGDLTKIIIPQHVRHKIIDHAATPDLKFGMVAEEFVGGAVT